MAKTLVEKTKDLAQKIAEAKVLKREGKKSNSNGQAAKDENGEYSMLLSPDQSYNIVVYKGDKTSDLSFMLAFTPL